MTIMWFKNNATGCKISRRDLFFVFGNVLRLQKKTKYFIEVAVVDVDLTPKTFGKSGYE